MAKRTLRSPAARRSKRPRPVVRGAPHSVQPLSDLSGSELPGSDRTSPRASQVVRRESAPLAPRGVEPQDRARFVERQPHSADRAAWQTDDDAEALHAPDYPSVAASDAHEVSARAASVAPASSLPPLAAEDVTSSGQFAKRVNDHDEHLLAHFFSSPPPEPSDALDEPYHVPMSVGSRRAMWSSLGIFAVAAIGIGGYTIYQQVVMPAPVELGSALAPDAVPAPMQLVPAALPASPAHSHALGAFPEREVVAQGAEDAPAATAAGEAELALARAPASAPTSNALSTAPASGAVRELAPMIVTAAAAPSPAPAPVSAAAPLSGAAPTPVPAPASGAARALGSVAALQASPLAPGAPRGGSAARAVGAIAPPPSAARVSAAPSVTSAAVAANPTPGAVAHVAEPEASSATPPSYDELLEVGRAFARKGQYEPAREAFQRALEAQPNDAPALAGMAFVYLNMDDRGMAKLFATRALAADATNSQGWIVLGAALEMLGDRAGAREAYRKCASDAVGSYVAECRNLAR
jgi:tetratricopeptide (TPR) repeat protein